MNKRFIYACLGIGLGALILGWLYTHAFIEIEATSPATINIQLTDAKGHQTKLTTDKSAKKLVRRGSYEVLVRSQAKSYVEVVHTGHFLSTSSVQATLVPEKARTFAGNNPSPCMQLLNNTLVSYGCADSFDQLQIHHPATATQPTYTSRQGGSVADRIVGFVLTKGGLIAVLQVAGESVTFYTAYNVTGNVSLSSPHTLAGMTGSGPYKLVAYKTGFVVYNVDFSKVLYYSSLQAAAVPIKLAQPADKSLKPYALSAKDDSLAVAYVAGGITNFDSKAAHPIKQKVAVVVQSDSSSRQLNFDKSFGQIELCGTEKLCALNSPQLEVYDITAARPRLSYQLHGVTAFDRSATGVVVARDKELLNIDVNTQRGSIDYSYDEYAACGLQPVPGGQLLCVTNPKNKKVALYIDQSRPDDSSIDKKVLGLLKVSAIMDVSAYGNYIHISPNLGNLVFTDHGYDYSAAAKAAAAQQINKAVKDLEIDTTKFKVINLIP